MFGWSLERWEKEAEWKEAEWALSQTIPHHVARLLKNKIFFFFHLLLLSIINYFFFRLHFFFLFFFLTLSRVRPAVERNSLRSMCIYIPFSGWNFCSTHNSHTGIVTLVTSKQRRGSRSVALCTLFLDFHDFEFNITDYIMLHSLLWQRQIKMSHDTKLLHIFKKIGQFHLTIEMYFQ